MFARGHAAEEVLDGSFAVVCMSADVFISHAFVDAGVAGRVCASLEAAGTRCWIAPRDIRPSEPWAAAIARGINESRALLVLVSRAANDSVQIVREVDLAAGARKALIGVRIEDVQPSPGLNYFLSSIQQVDLFPGPTQERIDWLARTVAGIVSGAAPTPQEPPPEPPFVEVDLDVFDKRNTRRTGIMRRIFEDR
jgi:hypothetical protein